MKGSILNSLSEARRALRENSVYINKSRVDENKILITDDLIIEGVRRTSFSGESQTIVLRGTVRPQDVTPVNTVVSYNLADVSIRFKDEGVVNNSQKKGWFGKLWEKVSPF